ncbi:MAG: response regulator transcription factor [Acidimicrobiales bacterium]
MIRVAVLNDYELTVAGVAAMLAEFPDRVRVVEMSVRDASVDGHVDLALFDTYGRADFAEEEIASLVADDRVGGVVVFTNSMPPAEVNRLLAIGAAGCLSKSLPADELVEELEAIMAGEHRVSSFEDLAEPTVVAPAPGGQWGLTYRESEVLALLTQGLRNKEIAAALYIGSETVKSHLASVFQKMGVSSRTQAIAAAVGTAAFGRTARDHD